MWATKLCRIPAVALVSTVGKPAVSIQTSRLPCGLMRSQAYATPSRTSSLRKLKGATIKDKLMAPAGDTAFTLGKGLVAGASVVGLGALCFYGLGMSSEVGAIDRAALWSDVVRSRIHTTYMYFGGSLALTAASAVALARNHTLMNLLARNSWMTLIGTLVAVIGSGMVCRSLPYNEGFGAKQLAWMVHSSIIGAVIAPITFLGGPIILRAACYTAGVVGGLSTVAVCAPSDKFLNMGGPLAMGLGVVFMSSIGSSFLPASSALGAGLYSISMYGGLVLFGLFLLYDTQKIIRRAETHPTYGVVPYDPVNASIGIYLDTINIFIRIAMLLAGGGNRRK